MTSFRNASTHSYSTVCASKFLISEGFFGHQFYRCRSGKRGTSLLLQDMQVRVLRGHNACVNRTNKTQQYNHLGTSAAVQVLLGPSGVLSLQEGRLKGGWSPFSRAFSSPTPAANLRQAVIPLAATCQSLSTSETHTLLLCVLRPDSGFCISGRLLTSELLSVSSLHKRMHNSQVSRG